MTLTVFFIFFCLRILSKKNNRAVQPRYGYTQIADAQNLKYQYATHDLLF